LLDKGTLDRSHAINSNPSHTKKKNLSCHFAYDVWKRIFNWFGVEFVLLGNVYFFLSKVGAFLWVRKGAQRFDVGLAHSSLGYLQG
jgi:hypothetical protein